MALATTDDLAARLPAGTIDDEDRAEALIAGASARVIAYTGLTFERAETTERIKVRSGKATLSQRPVHAISAVANVDGDDLAYTWQAEQTVYLTGAWPVVPFDVEPIRSGVMWVDVTYDHGHDTVPDVVVDIVCQVAARAYGSPATEGGITSETVDGYTYSRGAAAAVGVGHLFEDEKQILDQFRSPGAAKSMWPT